MLSKLRIWWDGSVNSCAEGHCAVVAVEGDVAGHGPTGPAGRFAAAIPGPRQLYFPLKPNSKIVESKEFS